MIDHCDAEKKKSTDHMEAKQICCLLTFPSAWPVVCANNAVFDLPRKLEVCAGNDVTPKLTLFQYNIVSNTSW